MVVPFNILSYGENHYDCNPKRDNSIHAEQDAVRKLPRHKRINRFKKLDILVIRVNRSGSLGNSKPCLQCLQTLAENLPEKGYTLSKVYYSNDMGEILETKLQTLLTEDTPHITKYYQCRPTKWIRERITATY